MRTELNICLQVLIVALCSQTFVYSQNIGINTTGATPNASSLLDIDASPGNDKGLLIPRLTTAQMNAISSPADGLIIYNTDCKSFNYYNGNTWIAIGNTGSVTAPGAITGSATPCQNATGVSYSITAVSGATGYNWTVPTGASVATGQGTTSVTVNFATTDGNVCVTASNACGTSTASCTAITLQSAPAAPTATAASNIAQTSFDANWNASAGATTYYLDVATDAGFTLFVTGYTNLNVGNVTTYGVTGLTCNTTYYYRVRASNSCGTSANSNSITVTSVSCFIVATGGTITTDGNFKVHTFNSSGTFDITSGTGDVEYLVIAGGGGGNNNGGGGAGGYRTATQINMTVGSYIVTVGAGGAVGANGLNSVFDIFTSIGGGAGGNTPGLNGAGGGSGGGARGDFGSGSGVGGAGTVGQGNNGGDGYQLNPAGAGGGGGGATSAGVTPTSYVGGAGGNGTSSSITGTPVTRAGGGGGGGWTGGGVGGGGGGGTGGGGGAGDGTAGIPNSGGGGGAAWGGLPAAGGSGVVIVRYQFQ